MFSMGVSGNGEWLISATLRGIVTLVRGVPKKAYSPMEARLSGRVTALMLQWEKAQGPIVFNPSFS